MRRKPDDPELIRAHSINHSADLDMLFPEDKAEPAREEATAETPGPAPKARRGRKPKAAERPPEPAVTPTPEPVPVAEPAQRAAPAIIIRDAFRNHLRPLSDREREMLTESIRKNGCIEPLLLWPTAEGRVLVDGHNRLAICQEQGVTFNYTERVFTDEDEVLRFIVDHARGKRNLTPEERRYYIGARYNREKDSQGGTGANQHSQSDQTDHSAKTCERIAHEERTGPASVRRYAKFAEQVDALADHLGLDIKWQILSGEMPFTPALAKRLLETEQGQAQNAIQAVTEQVKQANEQQPGKAPKAIKAAAILEALGRQEYEAETGKAPPEVSNEEDPHSKATQRGYDLLRVVRQMKEEDPEGALTFVETLRRFIRDCEKEVGL